MAVTAALLGTLLNTQADISYYVQQQIYWSDKYEANAAKLQKQTQYAENWEKAYDDVCYSDGSKEYKADGIIYASKATESEDMWFRYGDAEKAADEYAHKKVAQYDKELFLELSDLDMEYEAMKCMYDTLLEKMRADLEAQQQATSNAAQDTCLLQS